MALIIKQFVNSPLQNNNYLICDEKSKEAVLIDCSFPTDDMMNWATEQGFNLKYILLTHGHFDHVLGVHYYHQHYDLKVFLSKLDRSLIENAKRYAIHFQVDAPDAEDVQFFTSTDSFAVGQYVIQVIVTPGHTPGGVCYFVDHHLFSGDTLFHGTCGRTDFPEGNEKMMQESLKKLFKNLPDETIVYPGHGATTTIGHERWLY